MGSANDEEALPISVQTVASQAINQPLKTQDEAVCPLPPSVQPQHPSEPERAAFADEESFLEARYSWRSRIGKILALRRSLEASAEEREQELQRQARMDPMLAWMVSKHLPLTRDKYLTLNYPDGLPDPWTGELEMTLPEMFQQPVPPEDTTAIHPNEQQSKPQGTIFDRPMTELEQALLKLHGFD